MTSGGVTIVKVGGVQQNTPVQQGGYTRRAKLGDSRSTGRLHTPQTTNTHRSMTKLNIPGEFFFLSIFNYEGIGSYLLPENDANLAKFHALQENISESLNIFESSLFRTGELVTYLKVSVKAYF